MIHTEADRDFHPWGYFAEVTRRTIRGILWVMPLDIQWSDPDIGIQWPQARIGSTENRIIPKRTRKASQTT